MHAIETTRGGNGIVEQKISKRGLWKTKCEGMLIILLLVIRSLSHFLSSSKCAQGKAYNENI
jgi:hypothetical protein